MSAEKSKSLKKSDVMINVQIGARGGRNPELYYGWEGGG